MAQWHYRLGMRWNLTKIVPVALAATVLVPAFAEAEKKIVQSLKSLV